MDVDCNALMIVVCVLVDVMDWIVELLLLLSLIWVCFGLRFDFLWCLEFFFFVVE